MKRAILFQILFLFLLHVQAQSGIEGIFVEEYYAVSKNEVADQSVVGDLKAGMCTYRLYLDLAPGFRFQAAYGTDKHPLMIKSDGMFYNHPDVGNSQPNLIPARRLTRNVVLLDSWLSAGGAGETYIGIPRKHDDKGEIAFEKGYFNTTTSETDHSFTESDGLFFKQPPFVPTFYQMDEVLKGLTSVTRTNTIEITNGAWACMGKGALGADSTGYNMVLIGQFTTLGDLQYSLNVMIGTPDGKSVKYVYDNPQDGEIKLEFLKGKATSFVAQKHKRKKKNKKKN